jgi:type III secretion protein Q
VPVTGAVRVGLSLDALPADAVLEIDPSLGAGLVDRLAGGAGEAPPAREATPVERATLELLSLLALAGAAREEGAARLAPRLAPAPGRPAAPLSVEVVVSAGAVRGSCRLLVPEAAVRAVGARGELTAKVAAWPVTGSLCSGFAALPPGAADLLEPGDVVVLDEPPGARAFLFLPGLALRGQVLEGQFHVEDLAVTDQAAALPLTLTVEVARVTLPLGALAGLEPGAALPLHAPRDARVVLRLGERAVARGQLVEIEGALGVRIDELEAAP